MLSKHRKGSRGDSHREIRQAWAPCSRTKLEPQAKGNQGIQGLPSIQQCRTRITDEVPVQEVMPERRIEPPIDRCKIQ